jgi:transcription-repair coupling factor (superfamily II helicase)
MQKIEIYKKVVNVTALDEVADLHEELVDRFGDLPEAVENLLAVARIKVYGSLYAIESISQKGDDYQIKIHSDQSGNIEGKKLVTLATQFEGRLKVVPGPHILIDLRCKGLTSDQGIQLLEKFLQKYQEVLKTKGELQNVAK